GQGTRLLTHLVGLGKTYTATIRLGVGTTTDDAEGETLGETRDATDLPPAAIEEAASALRGDIRQVPSTVSAIKVDGKRAYARARAGEDVQLDARPVRIDRFSVLEQRTDGKYLDLDVVVTCSSGTYVRALARDLGAALGVGGHLTALRRTAVGPFAVEDAVHVPARGEGDDVDLPLAGLGATAARVLGTLTVRPQDGRALGLGQRITVASADVETREPGSDLADGSDGDRPVAALDDQGRLLALLTREGQRWRPRLVIPEGARS
ncbi:MAG: tRNA pseudouridine(55) synthase TruB, partial [Brachybacterium sp.]|nr:tRNA pseudouridine(55) synthase TruB [Brachybacterium sp.]